MFEATGGLISHPRQNSAPEATWFGNGDPTSWNSPERNHKQPLEAEAKPRIHPRKNQIARAIKMKRKNQRFLPQYRYGLLTH